MVKTFLFTGVTCLLFCLFPLLTKGQQSICYPLDGTLQATDFGAPPLSIRSNSNGQNGGFIPSDLPLNFCPQGGTTTVFHFEDNVGLAFDNNAADLIDCEYTVEFTVNFEELPASTLFDSPWIWVLGTYEDDDGIFIWRETLFGGLYIEFWDSNERLKTVPFNAFNTTDWFHFTITRDCSGLVQLYVNCQFFTDFNDTRNILRLHPSTGNTMIFFQDDPSVLVGDSAPGKVRDIKVSNYIKDDPEITSLCDCLCENMASDCPIEVTRDSFTCNPSLIGVVIDTISFSTPCTCQCDSIINTNFILLPMEECVPNCEEVSISDTLLCSGSIFNSILITQDTVICDTLATNSNCTIIECTAIQLLPNTSFQLDTFVCSGGSVLIDDVTFNTTGTYHLPLQAINGCDSLLTLNLTVLDGQTITVDTTVCLGSFLENTLIQNDTSFCNTVSSNQGCQVTFCYNVQVDEAIITQIQKRVCPGETWIFGDSLLTMPGLYTQIFSNRNGCDSLVQLQLDTISTPTVMADTSLCLGSVFKGVVIVSDTLICETVPDAQSCFIKQCYRITANNIYIVEQQVSVCEGEAYPFGDSIYFAPGNYLHPLKAGNGCDSIIVLTLAERMSPQVSIFGSPTLCPGKTSILEASSGFATYEWSPTGDTTEFVVLEFPGTYTVKVTDEFGCQNEQSIEVIEVPPVEVTIEVLQPELCPGYNDVILTATVTGGTMPYTYQWSDNSGMIVISDIPSGNYSVTILDEEGCSDSDTVNVEPATEFELQTEIVRPSCPESQNGAISVQAINGYGPFLYGINGSPLSSDSIFSSLETGVYVIAAEDINGCRQEVVLELLPNAIPVISIDPPTSSIVKGDSISLDLIGIDLSLIQTINWSPPDIYNCDSCHTVIAQPLTSTDIGVEIVYNNGCLATADAFIEVLSKPINTDSIKLEDKIFVPSAFSPNGDGVNDNLVVYGADNLNGYFSMKIFDRWGVLVYEGSNLSFNSAEETWGGGFNGFNAPAGVYIWSIVLKSENSPAESFFGHFTLLR